MTGRRAGIRKNGYRADSVHEWMTRLYLNSVVLRLMLVVLMICTLSWVSVKTYYTLIISDYFRADVISIEGISHINEQEMMRTAGLFSGINILSVNVSKTRRQLLAHPWVADAQVMRQLPGTLGIVVKEHVPAAIFNMGRKFIINTNGDIFKEFEPHDPVDLPVVDGLGFSDIRFENSPPTEIFRAVMEILQFARAGNSIIPINMIQSIQADREMGISLSLKGVENFGITSVKLGFSGFYQKFERMKTVFEYLSDHHFINMDTIDLSDPDRIVATPAIIDTPYGDLSGAGEEV